MNRPVRADDDQRQAEIPGALRERMAKLEGLDLEGLREAITRTQGRLTAAPIVAAKRGFGPTTKSSNTRAWRRRIRFVRSSGQSRGWRLDVADHYTYRITWSPEDGEHLGLCAEFPSLSWLASTPGAALSGIQALVNGVLADMQATGEPLPEPLADRMYSGRFMVRVPPETHRKLVIKAAEEGVSLNRLVSARLAG